MYFFEVCNVIFDNPSTTIIWKDGTSTRVRGKRNDKYDPEKGMALCFMKKALEGQLNYRRTLDKFCNRYRKETEYYDE